MASTDEVRAVIESHVAAVGVGDAGAVAALYAPEGRLHDPAGAQPIVGRDAIADYFAAVLSEPREVQIVTIAVVSGKDAAVHFRATPAGREPRDIIDTMTFDHHAQITVMHAYAS